MLNLCIRLPLTVLRGIMTGLYVGTTEFNRLFNKLHR